MEVMNSFELIVLQGSSPGFGGLLFTCQSHMLEIQ